MSAFEKWISGFISIADGIVLIATFGMYCPNWELDYCVYCVLSKNKKETKS